MTIRTLIGVCQAHHFIEKSKAKYMDLNSIISLFIVKIYRFFILSKVRLHCIFYSSLLKNMGEGFCLELLTMEDLLGQVYY